MGDFERYDSGFFSGRFNRMIDLIEKNRVLPVRPGWERTPEGVVPPPSSGGGGGFKIEFWDLKIVTEDDDVQVSIKNPGQIKRTTAYDDSGLVEVVSIDSLFTPEIDKFLCLVVEPDLTTTLELVEKWEGYPYPVKETDSDPAGKKILEKYYYVIWAFVAKPDPDADPPETAPFGALFFEDFMAVKWGFGTHLQFELSQDQTDTGAVVPYYKLIPGMGCEEKVEEE